MAHPSPPLWKLYHNPHFLPLPPAGDEISGDDLAGAAAEIARLLTDLDRERRLSKSISDELADERRRRTAAESAAARCRAAADLAVRETEDERRMLKFADALREERVQMKLADAAIALEETMRELRSPGSGEIAGAPAARRRESPRVVKGVKPAAGSWKEKVRARVGGNSQLEL